MEEIFELPLKPNKEKESDNSTSMKRKIANSTQTYLI